MTGRSVSGARSHIHRTGHETVSGGCPGHKPARQRVGIVDPGMGAVEGGVEAGNLHGIRNARCAARMPERLCGWCSGAKGLSFCRSAIRGSSSTMDSVKAMPPCTTRCPTARDRYAADLLFENVERDGQRGGVVGHLSRIERRIRELPAGLFGLQMRRRAQALDLAAHGFGQLRFKVEQRELDRGRSGVQGENVPHYSAACAKGRKQRSRPSLDRTLLFIEPLSPDALPAKPATV